MKILEDIDMVITEASEKITIHHGTSSKFLRSILKKGLVLSPKERRWTRQMDKSRESVVPISTLEGYIYFTSEPYLAKDIAKDASKKFGGNPLIVSAQASVGSTFIDHDELTTKIKETVEDVSRKNSEGQDIHEWYLGYLMGSETGEQIRHGNKFADELNNNLGLEGDSPLKIKDGSGGHTKDFPGAKLLMIYLALHFKQNNVENTGFTFGWIAANERLFNQGVSTPLPPDPDSWDSEHRDIAKHEVDKSKSNWPLNKSESELENIWREAIEHASRRITGDHDSVMIDEPINYRGSNKVVSIVEIVEEDGQLYGVTHYGDSAAKNIMKSINIDSKPKN